MKPYRNLLAVLALTLLGSGCAGPVRSVPAGPRTDEPPSFPLREHTLRNGMRLLILPRAGAPIASFVVQYRIGGVNEVPGNTGIAHFLEHLLFKGTTSVGTIDPMAEMDLFHEMDGLFDSILALRESGVEDPDVTSALRDRIRRLEEEASGLARSSEFEEILTANGARGLNATTTSETTTYFVELPSNRAELWFVLEADRMQNPVFREFYTERDVVAEERRLRLENSPSSLLYAALMATAFRVHPYGTPVVGSMEDIQSLTRREVEDYFRKYYGPNNAVVAIAGDVDPDQILQWAREYLEPIPQGEAPPPLQVVEPEQTAERRVQVTYDAEPALRIGWKVPATDSDDAPALYMMTSILTGGRASRLYRRLVLEERIASGVTSSVEPGQLFPGLFCINASPLNRATTEDLERAIYEEIEVLQEAPPDDGELQRVRNYLEASEVRRLRSSFALALQMAASATLYGDWRATFDFSRRLLLVTPEDIQRVAREYFTPERRTVATLVKTDGASGRTP